MVYLRQQAQENLHKHIHETIPHEYNQAMVSDKSGLKEVLVHCQQRDSRRKTRLQALALINDCNKIRVDLSTNGVVITDAIKYVNGKMDHLNKQEKKLLQDIQEKQKEEVEAEAVEAEDVSEGLDTTEQQTHNTVF